MTQMKIRIANLLNPWPEIPVDDPFLLSYHSQNTGKEVILKFMSSNHSEVAAA